MEDGIREEELKEQERASFIKNYLSDFSNLNFNINNMSNTKETIYHPLTSDDKGIEIITIRAALNHQDDLIGEILTAIYELAEKYKPVMHDQLEDGAKESTRAETNPTKIDQLISQNNKSLARILYSLKDIIDRSRIE